MRIVQGERVLLWARVWDDFYGIDVVFDHPIASPVIPTTAVEARRFGAWESPDWLSRWAHRFCDQLSGSVTPLHRGDWVLRPLEWPHSHKVRDSEASPHAPTGTTISPGSDVPRSTGTSEWRRR
jgi:hypothetical protein